MREAITATSLSTSTSLINNTVNNSKNIEDSSSSSNANNEGDGCGWYLQSVNYGLIGPVASSSVVELCSQGVIDGLTYIWKEGMGEWMHIADIDELKQLLISHEEEDEGNDDYDVEQQGKGLRVKEGLQHADDGEQQIPVYSTSERTSSSQSASSAIRLPLEEVSPKFKYIAPTGIGHVYDQLTSTWVTFSHYQQLLKTNNSGNIQIAQTDDDLPEEEKINANMTQSNDGKLIAFIIWKIEFK